MWSVDTRCPQCIHRKENPDRPDILVCPDRPDLYTDLQALTNKLNSDPGHQDPTPGNGVLIIACADFTTVSRS